MVRHLSQAKKGGAILGACASITLLFIMMLSMRVGGTIATIFVTTYEPILEARKDELEKTKASEEEKSKLKTPAFALRSLKWISHANESMSKFPGYGIAEKFDPLEPKEYGVFEKSLKVANDPDALERFKKQPGVKRLIAHPSLKQLMEDKDIQKYARERDIHRFLSHPRVRGLTQDSSFVKMLSEYNIDSALDKALKAPEPEKKIENLTPEENANPSEVPFQETELTIGKPSDEGSDGSH